MNCKYMNMLRVVRGNAFKLKIAVEAYTPSGRRIDSFALGEAVLKLDKNGTLTTKDYTILEGTTILVAFDGSESLGVYGFQMSGEYEGEAWRWANAEIFQIVETNAKANIPDGCVLLDDTYNMAMKIVLSGGDGVTFTPSVSEQGIISWTNDGGLPNPEPRNIRGPRGEQGPQGEVGPQGPRGQMGLRGQIGPKGDKGDKGDTGATPVLDVTASVDENVGNPMVVVESFGPAEHRTFDFQFKNLKGQKGETGATGPQGPQGQQGEPGNYTKPASGIPLSDLNGNVASGIVYDVTANNSGATFASLSALLSSGSLSTLIPTSVRKGGMQIRFVCSSDNKYVQFRYMPSDAATVATFTDVANWQGVDEEPTANSQNLVTSGGVADVEGYYKNSEEYSEVIIDQNKKILESRDFDGNKTFNCDVTFNGNVTSPVSKEEPYTNLIDAVIDSENKTIEGTDIQGRKIFYGGIITPDNVSYKTSVLYGKKWAVLGDSFTNGGVENGVIEETGKYTGYRCVYPYIIGNRTGINVLKFFEGGRTLAYPADGTFHNSVTDPNADCYYQNIPEDVDYITIYLGINDGHHAPGSSGGDGEDNTGEIPIGTITDNTTSTYYGAWNVVLSWLREHRPFAHLGIIVSNGCDSIDYVNAQIAIAEKYGFPYLNLNGDKNTPAMIRSWNTSLDSTIKNLITRVQAVDYDGTQTGTVNLHPNRDAHIFESNFIENFLNTL